MNPGHENCGHVTEYVHTWGQEEPHRADIRCDHDHIEEVRASDALGTGPVVADYCQCCDAIIRRGEYA